MIVSDSGWVEKNLGRCHNEFKRSVLFESYAPEEIVAGFIIGVKEEMHGQQSRFTSSRDPNGYIRVTFVHTVDSSD